MDMKTFQTICALSLAVFLGFGLGCMLGQGEEGLQAFQRGGMIEVVFGSVPVWQRYLNAIGLGICIVAGSRFVFPKKN